MKKASAASFFAGIGGFDLGFEQAGFEVNFQCEIHPFCGIVLRRHWPSLPLIKDISSAESKSIPDADVWCGGFPCQDLSVARGSRGRHGLNGSRSGLFFRLAALAKRKKPRVILIENVHGLLNANEGRDFAELLHTLGSLGYAVSWRLLNSRYFGLPQSRPRVYICAWLNDPIAAGAVLFEDRPPQPSKNERAGFLETSWTAGQGPITPKLAFCLSATSGRHTGTDWSRTYVAYEDEVRRLTPLECERLQGFPDGWTQVEPMPLDTERSDSLRYHALGNAVSVSVVKWVASRIKTGLQRPRKTSKNVISRRSFLTAVLRNWPGLSVAPQVAGDLASIRRSSNKIIWPNGGVFWKGYVVANRLSPSLHNPVYSDLLDIIERDRPDQRYFLSANAAEGILRRVDSQGRELFPPLRRALERLARRESNEYKLVRTAHQLDLRLPQPECVLP